MLHKRLYQFLIVYGIGISSLFFIKYILHLSDYVIPSPIEVWSTAETVFWRYLINVMDTLSVAIIGHILSIFMAVVVGIIARLTSGVGTLIKIAAFNIQAYPIVAVAPIIFILLGDGIASRLLIASMICYFPLLLAFLGILTQPVNDIEHFFQMTGRMTWQLEVKIRVFENISKLTTVVSGGATLAMVGTIVAEFIAANAGIGYTIRIALYQSDLAKILVALFIIGIWTSIYLTCLEWIGHLIQKKWEP
ncbi:MAG: ABC transporter permease subunit [Desulfobacterales bacterium]